MERPIAADMDQDGVDDIGLFVPRVVNAGEPVSADWYFLVSHGTPRPGSVHTLNHAFRPVPFGEDLAYTLFNGFNVPVVGNFDPPVGGTAPSSVFKAAAGTFADVVVMAQVDTVAVGGAAGLAARRSAGGNSEYWGGLVFNGATYTAEIRKKVAGNWTTLATTPVAFTPGNSLSFEVVGTSLTLSVEGQTVTEASDPSIRDAGGAGSDSSPSSVVWPPTAANVVRPAPPLPYSNTFDQPNGAPLGNSWNQWQGNFTVANGKLTAQAARNLATLFADKPRNVTVASTVTALAKNGYAALVARYNEQTGEMYYAQLIIKKGKYFAEIVKVSRGVKTKQRPSFVPDGTNDAAEVLLAQRLRFHLGSRRQLDFQLNTDGPGKNYDRCRAKTRGAASGPSGVPAETAAATPALT